MKKLLILSGKGGTGKTTTAATFIKFTGAKAIADCDVDAPNLHLVTSVRVKPDEADFIGAEKAKIDTNKCVSCGLCMDNCHFDAIVKTVSTFNIKEYACEGCGVCSYLCPQEAIQMNDDIAGSLKLYKDETIFSTAQLKMGRGNSGKLVAAVKQRLLKEATDQELTIIDGSPGIGCPVIASVSGMDMALIVTEPTVSGLSDLKRLIKSASIFEIKVAVCVNKWDISPKQTETIIQFCEDNSIVFAGKIPYDKTAYAAVNNGKSFADYDCPARDALKMVYENTMDVLYDNNIN
ncbi:MAG: 4Fe-4S binding protein [Clostridiales bacterium]|nr:4Fe-4S binding protein [Clostridiales bacterium]